MFSFLAIIGVLFPENKRAAYANSRLCQSLAATIGFLYSSYLCVRYKVYIIIATVAVTTISYLFLEFNIKRLKRNKEYAEVSQRPN